MIQCSICKVQCVGKTKRQLSERFGEYRRAIEKAITQGHIDQPMAITVSDHHSVNDTELFSLELIHSNRDSIRKAREAFLISKGKTLVPHGMNRRDELIYFCIYSGCLHGFAFYVCQSIIFNLFICIIFNLVTALMKVNFVSPKYWAIK